MKRRSPESLVYDTGAITTNRLLHRVSEALTRWSGNARLGDLEFELRYRRYLAEFGEADSDITVSTFSKSGTTWMQMILYQLTTAGDMEFDHLFDVSPWAWYAALRRVAPARTPAPRILKSHDDYRRFRKGRRGRFVFVTRDGRDVCLSLYHHRRNFKRFTGSFEEHFRHFLYGTDYNWFDHTRLWLENRYGLPIHYVRYEDLKRDFVGMVRRLAGELSIEVDDDIMARTVERCSFASMKRHELQLGPRNDHFENLEEAPYYVLNPDQFIRAGRVGDGVAELTEQQLAAYRERFDGTLAPFPLMRDYR